MKAKYTPERRKAGRPPNETPKASVTSWVPAPEYDRLTRLAKQREESLSSTVRQLLTHALHPKADTNR